ncbi:MAG: hypothetical protein Q9211_007039 [Gyalolechia sp. 1 TL-2023]
MASVERSRPMQAVKAGSHIRQKSEGTIEASPTKAKTARQQFQSMASRFSTGDISTVKKECHIERRATEPTISATASEFARGDSPFSVSPASSEPIPLPADDPGKNLNLPIAAGMLDVPNLDYLSFGDDGGPTPSYPNTGGGIATKGLGTDPAPECLSSPSLSVPFDSLFASTDALGPCIAQSPSTGPLDWGADLWTLPADADNQPVAQSVLSFTEEELTSGEEWSIHDGGSEFRDLTMPSTDGFGLETFDEHLEV